MNGDSPVAQDAATDRTGLLSEVGRLTDRGRVRRRVLLAGAGLGLFGLAGAGVLLRRPSSGSAEPPERRVQTVTVTRETLVDVITAAATLAYGPEKLVESRLAGTVTGLPPVGSVVRRGRALLRIDDTPVVLLYGTLPAYRDLTVGRAAAPPPNPTPSPAPSPGPTDPGARGTGAGADDAVPATRGADVSQFEKNLKALGYTGIRVDEQYTEQTAAVVRSWQKDLDLAQTGVVELGRVFYAPGPLRIARHLLAVGAAAAGPVLAVTGAARLVTATIPAHNLALAKVGTKVTVALPTGHEVVGMVSSVGTPTGAEQADGGQEPTLEVVVRLVDPSTVDGLDDGPAQVRFVAEQRKDVLVVPVGALLALAEGGYGLEVVQADGSTRVMAVTTGLFADGKVEVSGSDLHEGMTVGMAR